MAKESLEQFIDKLKVYFHEQKTLPSFREMKDMFGVKWMRSVTLIVDKLVGLGYLDRAEKGLLPGERLAMIPVFESVSAGFFSPATENRYEINIENYLVDKPQDTYFVKVIGDSMKNIGLMSGDFVIVDKSKTAPRDGEIIIAQTDEGVTVKRFRKQGEKVRLQPENEDYPDMIPTTETNILGSVIGSFRRFGK